MNKIQFDILRLIDEYESCELELFSRLLFKAKERIAEEYNCLIEEGYVINNMLSQKGKDFLLSHKVDNAVILAAGMSTRFVPLSFEKPKALLEVKGEVLIERQIRQLQEIGITEIVIVVGYMAEQFKYLENMYNVTLVKSDEYKERNNHASIYAARKYLKNTIITSSDLYFSENIFQRYFFDSYYCSIYKTGKTAERGILTDEDDRIMKTFYGDRCYDVWITLGYAVFSEAFSKKMIKILADEYMREESKGKFWADFQDEHLSELYMYTKRCNDNIIYEFDSLEELRQFDSKYINDSESNIMQKVCYLLAIQECDVTSIECVKSIKQSMFKFNCREDSYICDIVPDSREKLVYNGRIFYECRDVTVGNVKLYKMDRNIVIGKKYRVDTVKEVDSLYDITDKFINYHRNALPLCAAENVISSFANLPLEFGLQERYIMNNTYSFNMEDNFIGCEKLFPYYQKISEVCERMFRARYADPRPFTGMNCIDMIVKTICNVGDKMVILGKEHGGHASVKPVVERLGIKTFIAPYDIAQNDLDYDGLNQLIKEEKIEYILLAPSDIINPMHVEKINTEDCVLLYDCSQIMGIIAAGLCDNPLDKMDNVILFGGTHKTFPGPASGLILTNSKTLHNKMETQINPLYLRHSQMHQKASLLFALIEFEKFGEEYMSHVVHCSNYLGRKLREFGYDVADVSGQISATHQIFIRCSKEEMEVIYKNAYKYGVTLNKKKKELFLGYGIRLGVQEIARYDWNDNALDIVANIVSELSKKDANVSKIQKLKDALPDKKIHYTFSDEEMLKFKKLVSIKRKGD